MNIITAYSKGLKATFQSTKIWLWLYLANLFVALLVVMPLQRLMESKLAFSLATQKMLHGFNYTVYQDFMNEYGDTVFTVLGQAPIFILLFVLLYVFLTGGILSVFKTLPEHLDKFSFGKGCTYFFGRMLRLTIYFLILQLLLAAVFVGLYFAIADMDSDKSIVNTMMTMFILFVSTATIITMVQDYVKIQVVQNDEKWLLPPIRRAFRLTFRHFFKMIGLYGLNLLTFVIAFGLYWWFKSNMPSHTMLGVFIVFILSQLFLLARIGMKLLNLSSATVLYKNLITKEVVHRI